MAINKLKIEIVEDRSKRREKIESILAGLLDASRDPGASSAAEQISAFQEASGKIEAIIDNRSSLAVFALAERVLGIINGPRTDAQVRGQLHEICEKVVKPATQ